MERLPFPPDRDWQRWRSELSRWLEIPFPGFRDWVEGGNWRPSIDLYETADEVVAEVELPGINPDNVELRLTPDTLTIRGEQKEERTIDHEGYYRSERRLGSFYRQIPLPVEVLSDRARAKYRRGILEIRMPKAAPGERSGRSIQIETED